MWCVAAHDQFDTQRSARHVSHSVLVPAIALRSGPCAASGGPKPGTRSLTHSTVTGPKGP